MCNFNCKIRLQTFQMFLTKLKQKYKKIELLKNFCKNQIGFLQSLFLIFFHVTVMVMSSIFKISFIILNFNLIYKKDYIFIGRINYIIIL